MKPLVSVFTDVYNGSKTIHRVFDSMKKQTYKNVEHIIVNDGSTDFDLVLPELEKYISDVTFPVKVFHKENGGKHTATNVAWNHAEGEFIIQLDADDEIMPNAIEYLVNEWFCIPQEVRDEYWCVHGRCMDQVKHKFLGEPYPDNLNSLSFEEARKIAQKTKGEKKGLMRSDFLKNFRYPEPKGVKFVTESVLWTQIAPQKRIWYTNEVVEIYYINEGPSLSHAIRSKQSFANNAFNKGWFLEHRKDYPMPWKQFLAYVVKRGVSYFCATKEYKENHAFIINKKDVLLSFLQLITGLPCVVVAWGCKIKFKL